jgi:hypothetical protein
LPRGKVNIDATAGDEQGGSVGCGLRRAKAAVLKLEDVQLREGHWVIADLPEQSIETTEK